LISLEADELVSQRLEIVGSDEGKIGELAESGENLVILFEG